MNQSNVPLITIDGPSGSGKGTISQLLAARLGFHYLDSGALYRLLALAARRHQVTLDNTEGVAVLAAHMDITFEKSLEGASPRIILEGEDVSELIRGEAIGAAASQVAAIPEVRAALLHRQRAFARKPGLVADGRDMGTVVFPWAKAKIFLTASPRVRAERRYNQLIKKGETAKLEDILDKISARDNQDRARSVAPMVPAPEAEIIDSSEMTIGQVLEVVEAVVRRRLEIQAKSGGQR